MQKFSYFFVCRTREQLTKRIQQIDILLDAVAAFDGTAPKKARGPRGKGRMSAAGRAAIVRAQKARWAKVTRKAAKPTKRGRRKMSAAARAKIAAAARARWKKAKAAGRKSL